MCLIGMLKAGVYLDNLEGVDLEIDRHEGIGIGRGGGALFNEQIAHEQTANIQHDPFMTTNQQDAFWASFLNANNMGIIPNSYDLDLEDDKDMFCECIWMGHKCTELNAGIPIIHWCQALDILLCVQ